MAFYRMSGSSKGELHGASILVTVDGGTSGETVTLTKDTFSKSGVLSDDGTCLFTDLLEAGTYTATYQTFTASVEVSASDILNKVTKSVSIGTTTTINLILEGAKEDTITITDKNGATVGVCVFPTGSTVGEVEIDIIDGEEYTFTSSVAKGTTEETKDQDYSKTVTLYADGSHNTSDIGMVPVMTSNTTPSGEAIRSSVYLEWEAWYAFNGNKDNNWASKNNLDQQYIGYKFTNSEIVSKISIMPHRASSSSTGNCLKEFKVQGSNNGTDWVDVYDGEITNPSTDGILSNFDFTNNIPYLYYRILRLSQHDSTSNVFGVSILQFYSKGIKVMPEGSLYWYGNECTDKTGGWSADGYHSLSTPTDSSGIKETNSLLVEGQSSTNISVMLGTFRSVDFTGFNNLCIEWEITRTNSPYLYWINTKNPINAGNGGRISTANKGLRIDRADVTSFNLNEYVLLQTAGTAGGCRTTRVWLS